MPSIDRQDVFRRVPFRELLEKRRPGVSGRRLPADDPRAEEDDAPVIVCRVCRKHITDPSQRVAVDGAHRHTFANPHGHVFDIGCFRSAVGCRGIGPSSAEFTWFRGHSWQIVVCAGCGVHLGWFFASPDKHYFYGLILDRLAGPV